MRTVAKDGIWRIQVEKPEQKTLVTAEAILTKLGALTGDDDVAETARRLRLAIRQYCRDYCELLPAGKEPQP